MSSFSLTELAQAFVKCADELKRLELELAEGQQFASEDERQALNYKLAVASEAYRKAGKRFCVACPFAHLVEEARRGRDFVLAILPEAEIIAREIVYPAWLTAPEAIDDDDDEDKTLPGPDCPPRVRKLFFVLSDGREAGGKPLSEELVIESMYGVRIDAGPYEPAPRRRRRRRSRRYLARLKRAEKIAARKHREAHDALYQRCRTRLRKVEVELRKWLEQRALPYRNVRPYPHTLLLCRTNHPGELQSIRETLREESRSRRLLRAKPIEWQHRQDQDLREALAYFDDEASNRPAVNRDACKKFVLAKFGRERELDSIPLQESWKRRGGTPHTLRRTLDDLEVEHFPRGGIWMLRIPATT